MKSRRFIKLCQISGNIDKTEDDIEGNWVTIGVIGEKSAPKTASNGRKFCILKLTDFGQVGGKFSLVTAFLFDMAFERHWKETAGTVVAILNANLVPPNDVRLDYEAV